MRFHYQILSFCLMTLLGLSACGSAGNPFEMSSTATLVVGDTGDSPVHFILNPEQETGTGILTAQVEQEFQDRRTLLIQDLDITAEFSGIGQVRVVLNPNLESTGVVYKLNPNNQPYGTHMMNLNLIVETEDQNLTYDNVQLANENATLMLVGNLPVLTFFFDGQEKQLQILDMTVVVPAELISSDEDPN